MRNPSFSELEIGFCLPRLSLCAFCLRVCVYVCVVCGMCGFDAGSHSSRADKIGRTGGGRPAGGSSSSGRRAEIRTPFLSYHPAASPSDRAAET